MHAIATPKCRIKNCLCNEQQLDINFVLARLHNIYSRFQTCMKTELIKGQSRFHKLYEYLSIEDIM